jgi:hypothetical protein
MGGREPNRTATLSIAPSVAELQRENVVLELECIDRIYLNAFVPNLTSEKGIAGYFREFMGHRFASTKSAGKSEATGQAPGSSQHGRCQRISDRSCRAPERRRRNAQSGIQRPALLLPPCFAPRVWPRRAFGSVAESCPVLAMSHLLGEICSCFDVEITRPWLPIRFVSPGGHCLPSRRSWTAKMRSDCKAWRADQKNAGCFLSQMKVFGVRVERTFCSSARNFLDVYGKHAICT